ncbi:MAG: NAD(P)H-dependent oxidoreductase [Acidobacteriota bacterium]
MTQSRVLAFAGSAREASFNKLLVRVAAQGARDAGAEVTVLDLRDYPMPLFDQDLEAASGLPDGARAVKAAMMAADGLLIASPEYNSSITPLLKNTLDWVSRREGDEPRLAAYQGKCAALMSASPGGLGGLRGLGHVRSILQSIGVMVIPDQIAVPAAHGAFGDDGTPVDPKLHAKITDLGRQLATLAQRLKG